MKILWCWWSLQLLSLSKWKNIEVADYSVAQFLCLQCYNQEQLQSCKLELHMLHTHHVHSSGGRCSALFSQMQWLIHVFEKLVAHTPETKRKILSKEMCAKTPISLGITLCTAKNSQYHIKERGKNQFKHYALSNYRENNS